MHIQGVPAISVVASVPASSTNRYLPLAEPEETTESRPEVQVQEVYRPPHARTPFRAVTPMAKSDSTANNMSTIHSGRGFGFDRVDTIITRLPISPTDPSAALPADMPRLDKMSKAIYEHAGTVRKMPEVQMTEEPFPERAQKLSSEGPAEKIQTPIHWTIDVSHLRQPPPKSFHANTTTLDLLNILLGPQNAQAHETQQVLEKKGSAPGGPRYSSVTGYQAGTPRRPTSVATIRYSTQPSASTHQATAKEQSDVYHGITSHRGPVSSGVHRMPLLYQTPPATRTGSVPPRFHQLVPLHYQTFIPKGRINATPPPWSSAPSQNRILGNKLLLAPTPLPPLRNCYDMNKNFDSEGVALSPKYNDDVSIEKNRKQCEGQTTVRFSSRSRLEIWSPNSIKIKNTSGSALGNLSSSSTPATVASSSDPVTGGEGSMETSQVGKREVWKNIADLTWAFGTERPGDEDFYPTEVAQVIGWQVDPSPPQEEEEVKC